MFVFRVREKWFENAIRCDLYSLSVLCCAHFILLLLSNAACGAVLFTVHVCCVYITKPEYSKRSASTSSHAEQSSNVKNTVQTTHNAHAHAVDTTYYFNRL